MANTLIVGKLKVKEMAKKKKGSGNTKKNKIQKTLNHSVQNTGSMARLTEFLTYKAEKVGKKVIRIGEEKTTKACCLCGKLKKRPIYERIILCECGNHINQDLNSAINIMVKFLQKKQNKKYDFLSHKPSVNEELFLQIWDGFLRHTAPSVLEAMVDSQETTAFRQ
jgi:transposase